MEGIDRGVELRAILNRLPGPARHSPAHAGRGGRAQRPPVLESSSATVESEVLVVTPETPGMIAGPVDDLLARTTPDGPLRARLRSALFTVCEEFGFETASLFVRTGDERWTRADRVGPVRPWHAVLDPGAVSPMDQPIVFGNVRLMPGIGRRLASMGCGSVAMYTLPDGAKLILDGSNPHNDPEAARGLTRELLGVFSALNSALRGLTGPSGPRDEVILLGRMMDAIRRTLDSPGCTLADVLSVVRDSLDAEDVAVICEDDDGVQVARPRESSGAQFVPSAVDAITRNLLPGEPIGPEAARRLASAVGVPGAAAFATFCRRDDHREILVIGQPDESPLDPSVLEVVARFVGSFRVAVEMRTGSLAGYLREERTRWAHAIHDGITQSVTAAVIRLESLKLAADLDGASVIAEVDAVQEDIRTCLAELRGVIYELTEERSPSRERPIEALVNDIVRRWRLPARIVIAGDERDVPESALVVAHLVVREALTNAAKHSGAQIVEVNIVASWQALTVEVKDNGRGFDPRAFRSTQTHFGLGLTRKRVEQSGGTFQVNSSPGGGTSVLAFIPAASQRGNRQ